MKIRNSSFIVGALLLAACGSTGTGTDEASADRVFGGQGLYLRSDIETSSDVSGIRFDFTPVSCTDGTPTGDPGTSVARDLEPFKIPGGIGSLEDNPLDADSEHYFADAFETLDPGCYDVVSTPIQESGEVSEMCLPANESGVEVFEGETTEILLINQCGGSDPGALDTISTLNHEPEILDVNFEESKFVACGSTQTVCATVLDPDNDPLEFVWELSADSPFADGPTVVSRDTDPETGAVTECVEFAPYSLGRYDVDLTVYDLLVDGSGTMRIEDYLAAAGYPSESHSSLDFFFYVGDGAATGSGSSVSSGFAASTAADLLILDTSIRDGAASAEATVAASLGYTVDIVDAATWGAMTTADFAGYKAIILGDRRCEYSGIDTVTGSTVHTLAAEENAATWSAAVTGNVITAGVDPSFHYFSGPVPKATTLLENYINFAAAEPGKTGAFVLLSCYYIFVDAASPVDVPFLSGFGDFKSHQTAGGLDAGHITATHPALTGMTDADISSWGNTVHEVFSAWPSNFEVLAISPDGTGFVAGDGVEGAPFVLARGVIPSACGNGTLDPAEECDDGNNESGDGCDAACNLEVCGDEVVQGGEACDDGNTEAGDGCSATCEVEACIPEAL